MDKLYREIVLEIAKAGLEEAYCWEKSLHHGAKLQININLFLLFCTVSIGIWSNIKGLGSSPLVFSIIITLLLSTLCALISQWRLKRSTFPDTTEVIEVLNNSKNKVPCSYDQLIGNYEFASKTVNQNNRSRMKFIHLGNIFMVLSIIELIIFAIIQIVCL